MRVYISADLEGITGVSKWEETEKGGYNYEEYRKQMTKEVIAACEGAIEAGADYIMVKDAHDDGKNLITSMLPKGIKVISGWSNHPYGMVEGLDESFDAVVLIGYHSGSSSNGSPLAHTLYPEIIKNITINGENANEFMIHAYACYMVGVPIVAVSGDGDLMRTVKAFNPTIKTVAVQEGFGGAMVTIHPELAVDRIRKGVKLGIESIDSSPFETPEEYEMEIEFKKHADAYKFSFYPNVEQVGEYTIRYSSNNYMHLLILLLFIG